MTVIKHINIDLKSFQVSSLVLWDPHALGTFLYVLWQEVIFAVLIRWISEMTWSLGG